MSDKTVDLCIVATPRPDILKRTLNSFVKYVKFSGIFKVYINIDKIYGDYEECIRCLSILLEELSPRKFSVQHIKISDEPNFCKAVQSLWAHTQSNYVFHLEDDWEFIKGIDIDDCISRIDKVTDYIRFPKVDAPHLGCLHKVALQPSFWRGSLVRELSHLMDSNRDPEKQLRVGERIAYELIDSVIIDITITDYMPKYFCKDIGRKWREERRIEKINGVWYE